MILTRLGTFIKSLWFHVCRGLPKATKKEILDRYEICIVCEDFDSKKSECKVCGCVISNRSQFLNKLAWADQQCPKNKWLKIER